MRQRARQQSSTGRRLAHATLLNHTGAHPSSKQKGGRDRPAGAGAGARPPPNGMNQRHVESTRAGTGFCRPGPTLRSPSHLPRTGRRGAGQATVPPGCAAGPAGGGPRRQGWRQRLRAMRRGLSRAARPRGHPGSRRTGCPRFPRSGCGRPRRTCRQTRGRRCGRGETGGARAARGGPAAWYNPAVGGGAGEQQSAPGAAMRSVHLSSRSHLEAVACSVGHSAAKPNLQDVEGCAGREDAQVLRACLFGGRFVQGQVVFEVEGRCVRAVTGTPEDRHGGSRASESCLVVDDVVEASSGGPGRGHLVVSGRQRRLVEPGGTTIADDGVGALRRGSGRGRCVGGVALE